MQMSSGHDSACWTMEEKVGRKYTLNASDTCALMPKVKKNRKSRRAAILQVTENVKAGRDQTVSKNSLSTTTSRDIIVELQCINPSLPRRMHIWEFSGARTTETGLQRAGGEKKKVIVSDESSFAIFSTRACVAFIITRTVQGRSDWSSCNDRFSILMGVVYSWMTPPPTHKEMSAWTVWWAWNNMSWPSRLPDPNPNNHQWQIVEWHARKGSPKPSSKHQLMEKTFGRVLFIIIVQSQRRIWFMSRCSEAVLGHCGPTSY